MTKLDYVIMVLAGGLLLTPVVLGVYSVVSII